MCGAFLPVDNDNMWLSCRPQSWSHNSDFLLEHRDNHLNLVLLGAERLADQLAKEIRVGVSGQESYI